MKITTFNPLIITKDPESAIQLFEALGFERHHTKEGIGDNGVTDVRMKDSNGFYVDVTKVNELERDMTIIRMNVDDLDEAFALLTARGFKAVDGSTSLTSSSKSVLMASPSGFAIDIVKHIKDHD